MKYLLDTHVLLFWAGDRARLSRAQRRVLDRAAKSPVLLSDISLWEIAMLVERGRLALRRPLREWLDEIVASPEIERIGIGPAVAAEVAALPPSFHRDPGDRILVATARAVGATLLTQDSSICDSGLVTVLA